MTGWDGQFVRVLDAFQGGPNLVRGFAPAGFGPRDLTPGTNNDALGGTQYWATSLEFQTPLFFAPKDFGMRLATFADAGMLWGFNAPTFDPTRPAVGMVVADSTQDPFRRSASACSGIRRSVRCASISPMRSRANPTTTPRSSASAAAPSSSARRGVSTRSPSRHHARFQDMGHALKAGQMPAPDLLCRRLTRHQASRAGDRPKRGRSGRYLERARVARPDRPW